MFEVILAPHFVHSFLFLLPVNGPGAATVGSSWGGGFLQYILRCFLMYEGARTFPHPGHSPGVPPTHVFSWLLRLCFSLKLLVHFVHVKLSLFLILCILLSCCISPVLDRHTLSQPEYLHLYSSSVLTVCDLQGFSSLRIV